VAAQVPSVVRELLRQQAWWAVLRPSLWERLRHCPVRLVWLCLVAEQPALPVVLRSSLAAPSQPSLARALRVSSRRRLAVQRRRPTERLVGRSRMLLAAATRVRRPVLVKHRRRSARRAQHSELVQRPVPTVPARQARPRAVHPERPVPRPELAGLRRRLQQQRARRPQVERPTGRMATVLSRS
jgi:hypothetical protein